MEKSYKDTIESMQLNTVEALKEIKPGTPEWDFCMRSLKAYEVWYLGYENMKEEF